MRQETVFHEQLRTVIEGRIESQPVAFEFPDDSQQQRVVFLIAGGIAEPHVQRAPVGQNSPEEKRAKQNFLFDFSRHHDFFDPRLPKQADAAANAGQSRRDEMIAMLGKFFRRHAFDADAVHAFPLPTGRLREGDGKSAGTGQ